MSKLFSRVSLTAHNGSTDEYLCPGIPDTEEQIVDTDGYCDFIEDNPDAESVTVDVEHHLYGEGEVIVANEYEVAAFTGRGEKFLTQPDVHWQGSSEFSVYPPVIQTQKLVDNLGVI